MGKIRIRQATKQGFIECRSGGVADLSYPTSKTRRGRVEKEGSISPTITTHMEICKMESENRIRRLTPRECWRLMDFTDDDFDQAAKVNAETHLYQQAGNSIVVNVLVAIFGQMYPGKENVYKGETENESDHRTDRKH